MTSCPKCGYERQRKDDEFVPQNECPKCGIIYEKFEAAHEDAKEISNPRHNGHRITVRPFALSVIVCILTIVCVRTIVDHMDNSYIHRSTVKTNSIDNSISENTNTSSSTANKDTNSQTQFANNNSVFNKFPEQHEKSGKSANLTIDTLMNAFNRPLNRSDIFTNQLNSYQWESMKRYDSYSKINSILHSYRRQHTYMKNELFVCADMAMDIWNLLTTERIASRIVAGNVEIDILDGSTIKSYLSNINHVWVLAEVSPSFWVPLETTGGYIVEPFMTGFRLYNTGVIFENPKQYKEFDANRNAMFQSMNEAASMVNRFNDLYARKPTTPEAAEYMGRMKQKLDDCEQLVSKVTASMQRR